MSEGKSEGKDGDAKAAVEDTRGATVTARVMKMFVDSGAKQDKMAKSLQDAEAVCVD
jgi:hypothetical protein